MCHFIFCLSYTCILQSHKCFISWLSCVLYLLQVWAINLVEGECTQEGLENFVKNGRLSKNVSGIFQTFLLLDAGASQTDIFALHFIGDPIKNSSIAPDNSWHSLLGELFFYITLSAWTCIRLYKLRSASIDFYFAFYHFWLWISPPRDLQKLGD